MPNQSDDDTREVLAALKAELPELRVLAHQRRCGQSTAIRTGVRHALSPWIATLDGDGQNDPADIHKLLEARAKADPATRLIAGWRVDRKDSASKRWASRWANRIRRRLLRDDTPDTGCGLKLFERAAFLDLPYFDHMHRYLPALMQRAGWKTISVPVSHRPRAAGQSKYNNLGRALVGKRCLWVVTTGGDEASYGDGGMHALPFATFEPVVAQTARFCGMQWLDPLVVHAAHRIDDEELFRQAGVYRDRLSALFGGS